MKWTNCGGGEYQSHSPSATVDRGCMPCTSSCTGNTYLNGTCANGNTASNPLCSECTKPDHSAFTSNSGCDWVCYGNYVASNGRCTVTTAAAKLVVEQKLQLRGATKKQIEENKKNVEKALATTLGVPLSSVRVKSIFDVQNRRRSLLASLHVEIIYTVEVEDAVGAKEIETSMTAELFKSDLSNNIQSESPNLSVTVQKVETPTVKRVSKTLIRSYKEAPSTNGNGQKQESSLLPFVAGFLAVSAVVIGGGVVVYNQRKKTRNSIVKANVETDEDLKNRNTWDMNAIELKSRNVSEIKNPNRDNEVKSGPGVSQLNPVRASAVGFSVEEHMPKV